MSRLDTTISFYACLVSGVVLFATGLIHALHSIYLTVFQIYGVWAQGTHYIVAELVVGILLIVGSWLIRIYADEISDQDISWMPDFGLKRVSDSSYISSGAHRTFIAELILFAFVSYLAIHGGILALLVGGVTAYWSIVSLAVVLVVAGIVINLCRQIRVFGDLPLEVCNQTNHVGALLELRFLVPREFIEDEFYKATVYCRYMEESGSHSHVDELFKLSKMGKVKPYLGGVEVSFSLPIPDDLPPTRDDTLYFFGIPFGRDEHRWTLELESYQRLPELHRSYTLKMAPKSDDWRAVSVVK